MRLKELRTKANLKQREVAEILGIPTKTYQNYEREVRDPEVSTMCKLADYYGVTLDELFGRQEYQSENEVLWDHLSESFESLNDEGKTLLADYADTLVQSGKYDKSDQQIDQSE